MNETTPFNIFCPKAHVQKSRIHMYMHRGKCIACWIKYMVHITNRTKRYRSKWMSSKADFTSKLQLNYDADQLIRYCSHVHILDPYYRANRISAPGGVACGSFGRLHSFARLSRLREVAPLFSPSNPPGSFKLCRYCHQGLCTRIGYKCWLVVRLNLK